VTTNHIGIPGDDAKTLDDGLRPVYAELPPDKRPPDAVRADVARKLLEQPEFKGQPLPQSPQEVKARVAKLQARNALPATGLVDTKTVEVLGVTTPHQP
jgi:hypothetical protein